MDSNERPFEEKQEKFQDLIRRSIVLEADMADVVRIANELQAKLGRNIKKAQDIKQEAEEFVEDFERPRDINP